MVAEAVPEDGYARDLQAALEAWHAYAKAHYPSAAERYAARVPFLDAFMIARGWSFRATADLLEDPPPAPVVARWRCRLCGRDTFVRKCAHTCVGGYRKRHLKWEPIYADRHDEELPAVRGGDDRVHEPRDPGHPGAE